MTKTQLQEVLGTCMEKIMQSQMAEQLGCDRSATDQVMAMAALRMIHDIAANSFEKGANLFVDQYGWEIDGFTKTLKEPVVSQAIDQCLTEIAAESPEILQYFESPYARLGLSWSGALLTCIKKAENNTNAAFLGPRNFGARGAFRNRVRGGPADWQEHGDQPSPLPDVLKV